jgi:hypothetical protein
MDPDPMHAPDVFYKAVKRDGDGNFYPLQDPSVVFNLGETYTLPEIDKKRGPRPCKWGWHACRSMLAILVGGYGYEASDPVLEVELGPDAVTDDGLKWCSLVLRVRRVMPEEEVARMRAAPQCLTVKDRTMWFMNGVQHRDGDLPAVIWKTGGAEEWYRNGKRHRDGDLPAAIWAKGVQEWWVDGVQHRGDDLPAVVTPRYKEWRRRGVLHRDGGLPAVVWANGTRAREWWVDGKQHRDGGVPPSVVSALYKATWNAF